MLLPPRMIDYLMPWLEPGTRSWRAPARSCMGIVARAMHGPSAADWPIWSGLGRGGAMTLAGSVSRHRPAMSKQRTDDHYTNTQRLKV